MKLQTPKGFRDFLPKDALKRKFVVDKIVEVFEKFGFDPLETPTLEYEETLTGKYGEEEKLIYKFETQGKDKVALKYDQTVPLARVIAQYGPNGMQKLPIPFKRYQIQPAYRGENTQRGRYREFLQCDADIVGESSSLADAEILALAYDIYKNLFRSRSEDSIALAQRTLPSADAERKNLEVPIVIKINDRSLLAGIEPKYLSAIDKLGKIGEIGVVRELEKKGFSSRESKKLLEEVRAIKTSAYLRDVIKIYEKMGYPKESLLFDPTLVRGLDYYTGLIFEVVLKDDPNGSSLCGGGRWDKMIGQFTGVDLPAVGFAIGLDRTAEAMEQTGVLESNSTNTKVLVTIFSPELVSKSIEVSSRLRSNNIPSEVWLDPQAKLEKQLKYADQKGIPYAVIIGPDESNKGMILLKDLQKRSQQTLSLDELIEKLTQ